MKKLVIHFAYTVPLSRSKARRAIDKLSLLLHFSPLYRQASDIFIPWQKPVRSPHSITYHLLHAFKKKQSVKFYNMFEKKSPRMEKGDFFIGQPLPSGGFSNDERSETDEKNSISSQVVRNYPSERNFLIMPYTHDSLYVSWAKELVSQLGKQNGGLILVGGKIWEKNWEEKSPFKDIYIPRKIHVEMGIDPNDYPRVKTSFNPKGKRKFLYIGHTGWYKNTEELERIAAKIPNFEGGHIGAGTVKGWKKISDFASLTPEFMSQIAKEYDIFVSASIADAQATTILEQMCLGFVVATTPQSGYDHPSLIKLHTTDTQYNVERLQDIQYMDEETLFSITEENRRIAASHHSWDKFTSSIINFMGV